MTVILLGFVLNRMDRITWYLRAIVFLLILIFISLPTRASATTRSPTPVREFKRAHPCPATAQARGPCPGYVVDHVVPLCAGGADAPGNMQWQTTEDARAKDREERAQCRKK